MKSILQRTSKKKHPAQGFSLPEVTMSLGIAAVSLLTLFSLLPFGLETLRDSSNRQAEARIMQSVMGRFQMENWIEESAAGGTNMILEGKTLFYDQTGTELANGNDFQCSYAVQVKVDQAPTVNGDVEHNPYLRQLNVRITNRPANSAQALADGSGLYREHRSWIALMEHTGPLTAL